MINSNSLPSKSNPAGQAHRCEQFLGDGQRDTFDLHEVPSSIPAMVAFITRTLYPMRTPLVIGDITRDSFTGGYNALVDRVGKHIHLDHTLPKAELLYVDYPFDDSNQSSAVSAATNSRTEPLNIPGWEPWDYQNWRDFFAAMHEDKPIEYAMCVWLMQQESTDQAFRDGEWSAWYHYTRKHCLRFDRERPRRR